MDIAKEQLHGKIKEHRDYESFVMQFALSFVIPRPKARSCGQSPTNLWGRR